MSTTTETVQEAAQVAYDAMEGGGNYVRLKDGGPGWVKAAVYEAHDGLLPDDWTFSVARSAFECISVADDPEDARHEWADAEVDVYTDARIKWLADYPAAVACCDNAIEEGIADATSILSVIAAGQYVAATAIFGSILSACEAQAE